MNKIVLLTTLLCFGNSYPSHSQVSETGKKALQLTQYLNAKHYQPIVWNDSTSALLYEKWLHELDDDKSFFTKADISLLEPFKYKLDDEIAAKSTAFLDLSIKLVFRRIEIGDSLRKIAFAKPMDFSTNDNYAAASNNYAANEKEFAARYFAELKYQVLLAIDNSYHEDSVALSPIINDDFKKRQAEAFASVKKVKDANYKLWLNNKQAYTERMHQGWLNAIAWCYDPHSNYFDEASKRRFEAATSATQYEAGFALDDEAEGDEKLVGKIEPGSAAWKSGQLHQGDKILKIKLNGIERNVEDVSAEELEKFLAGNSGGNVEITIKNKKGNTKTVTLVQQKVEDEDELVKSYLLKGKGNIGYIKLPGFYSNEGDDNGKNNNVVSCANDVSKEILKLKKDDIKGLILDLRYNGGGSMWEAMQLAGIFVDIGPVAGFKDRSGKMITLKDPNRGTIYDGPLMILINGASASASEFFSAAMQDYGRALIVGGNTYGKGTAQGVFPMDTNYVEGKKMDQYSSFVKTTGAKFYRINGSTVQWLGVAPDIAWADPIPFTMSAEKTEKSALKPDEGKRFTYTAYPPPPISALKAKSEARQLASPYFRKAQQLVAQLKTDKTPHSVPLQWSAYVKYHNNRVEGNDEDKNLKPFFVAENNGFDKVKAKTYSDISKLWNDELLNDIATDAELAEALNIMNDWITL